MRTPQAAHLEMNAAYPEFKKVRCDLQVLLTAGSYRTRGRVAKLTKREWRETPSMCFKTDWTSPLVRTIGRSFGRFARTKASIFPSGDWSTSRYRKTKAFSAWFCVEALTLTLHAGRRATLESSQPIELTKGPQVTFLANSRFLRHSRDFRDFLSRSREQVILNLCGSGFKSGEGPFGISTIQRLRIVLVKVWIWEVRPASCIGSAAT